MVLAGAIVFQVLFIEEDDPTKIILDWTSSQGETGRIDIVRTLSFIGCGLAFVFFIVSSLGKRVVCRVIPSLNLNLPSEITRVGVVILQFLSTGIATIIVLNQTQANFYNIAMLGDISLLNVWDDLALGI